MGLGDRERLSGRRKDGVDLALFGVHDDRRGVSPAHRRVHHDEFPVGHDTVNLIGQIFERGAQPQCEFVERTGTVAARCRGRGPTLVREGVTGNHVVEVGATAASHIVNTADRL